VRERKGKGNERSTINDSRTDITSGKKRDAIGMIVPWVWVYRGLGGNFERGGEAATPKTKKFLKKLGINL